MKLKYLPYASKKYRVKLTETERSELLGLLNKGRASSRSVGVFPRKRMPILFARWKMF